MSPKRKLFEIDLFTLTSVFSHLKTQDGFPVYTDDKTVIKLLEEVAEMKYQLRLAEQMIEDLTTENSWLHLLLNNQGPLISDEGLVVTESAPIQKKNSEAETLKNSKGGRRRRLIPRRMKN